MIKCATEMLISTMSDRATAEARLIAERERQERLEAERRERIRQEAIKRADELVAEILMEFENDFKNYGGNPLDFTKEFRLKYTCRYAGCGVGGWHDDGEYYYPIKRENKRYANGDYSYVPDLSQPINLTVMVKKLEALCYTVSKCSGYFTTDYRHYGSGEIVFPIFTLSLNPQCLL